MTLVAVHAGLELQAGKPSTGRATTRKAGAAEGAPVAHAAPARARATTVTTVAAREPRPTAVVDPDEIRRLADDGMSQRVIAERLGTSKSTVAQALARIDAA